MLVLLSVLLSILNCVIAQFAVPTLIYNHANYPRLACNVQRGINVNRGVTPTNWHNSMMLEFDEHSVASGAADARRESIGCGKNYPCSSGVTIPSWSNNAIYAIPVFTNILNTWTPFGGAQFGRVYPNSPGQCDEFPVAASFQGGTGSRMCVPDRENGSAGQKHKKSSLVRAYNAHPLNGQLGLTCANIVQTIGGLLTGVNNPQTGQPFQGIPFHAATVFTSYADYQQHCNQYRHMFIDHDPALPL